MSLPDTMRFIDHGKGGAPSVLQPVSGPLPQPQSDEVLIRVAFAGVNRPDVLQRSGNYPPPPGASPYLGLEVSGEVVTVGSGVVGFSIGDRVCALTNGGGYAEYVAVPAGQVLPVPAGLSMLQAAALPETYFTVFTNVIERGMLKPGETFLVHGGSSGIGLTAIQMAKAWGATVYTTVGNEQKAKACLALEGRLVQIAFLQPSKVDVDWMPLMIKRLTYTGSTLRARPAADKARLADELRTKIWPHLEQSRMLPVIHQVFELDEAAAAHALMESSTHIGKIMLKVAGE